MTTDTRAVSGTLGVVLLFSIIIAGMVLTVTISATALDQTRDQLGTDRAEKTLTQLDSKSAVVALGQSDFQNVPLARSDGADYTVRPDSGWLNVSVTNTSSGRTTGVVNETLGAVVYENREGTIAYQGGGVWKKSVGGATMVSPPEFHWRNATLTLPLITVDGERSIDGGATVSRTGSPSVRYPNAKLDRNFTNPLENGRVNVTVQSVYYRAWGRYFEQRTDGDVTYDHSRETVTIVLVVPPDPRNVQNSLASTSPSGSIELSGSGSDTARTDSYTSGDGDGYAGDDHFGGNISAGGTIKIGGNACVVGSLRSGKNVEGNSNGNGCGTGYKVTGDVFYSTSQTLPSSEIKGDEIGIGGISTDSNVDVLVDDQVKLIKKNDDSGTESEITGDLLDLSDGDVTLTSGNYYLEEIDLGAGDTLTLDTNGGDIAIGVENYVKMTADSKITVQGSGKVRVFVKGATETASGHDIELEKVSGNSPSVTTPNMNASKMWVYGKSDTQGFFKGSTADVVFQGVVYAPGGADSTGNIFVEKTQFYGGLVGANVDIDQGAEFHYDRYLNQVRTIPKRENVVRVTYLHISVNPITFSS